MLLLEISKNSTKSSFPAYLNILTHLHHREHTFFLKYSQICKNVFCTTDLQHSDTSL